ncbi:hypothetical protein [Shewanella sp. 10N.286.54.B9]
MKEPAIVAFFLHLSALSRNNQVAVEFAKEHLVDPIKITMASL